MLEVKKSCLSMKYFYCFIAKRGFDIFVSAISLLVFSPLFIVVAIITKLSSKGELIFKHKRIGYLGREFKIYKFRTMMKGAEDYSLFFTPEQIAEFHENYKLRHDPRITPIGKFLRRTSLDELPQLVNVLKGEMSIVGPRPVTIDELKKYGESSNLLLSVRPGITGLWQVSGRSDTTYEERVNLDVRYAKDIGLLLDAKIFFKTFIKVLLREGVY